LPLQRRLDVIATYSRFPIVGAHIRTRHSLSAK
jgi:hypothetical protein